jgi:hypothetical protein
MTDGTVVFEDDPSIEDADPVWRRIPPGWWTYDHNEGRVRPSSGNFQYSPRDEVTGKKDPMSVTLGKGLTPDVAIAGQNPGFTVVEWNAGYLRGQRLGIRPGPLPDVTAHGLVFSMQQDSKGNRQTSISGPVQKALAAAATWAIPPSAEEIEQARLRTAAPPSDVTL